jgi:methionyl-tRNA synthetase
VARRFYVTTPIYYVNDAPHLGTAYTTVVADSLARFHRLLGDDVWFLTGTDEHGLKIQRTAAAAGRSPQEWVDELSARYLEAWEVLHISNDDFVRTTEERHHRAVRRFMQQMFDNGAIYLGTYSGWYCVACEAYYGEDELASGRRCSVHGREVEWMEEENYFFALSRYADQLLAWYEAHPEAVRPGFRRNEALGFINSGLRDISITRTSIDWGVRVPWDVSHVFYVWCDALINYVSAIDYGAVDGHDPVTPRFATWWPASLHLLGKDILRFHCVWWPAMCLAAGIDPPAWLFVHGHLLIGGEKMSKSAANQVDPVALSEDLGPEALRYSLLREVSLGADGDFSYEALVARYNADLANNLGNLLARVATVVSTKCGGIGPAARAAGPLVTLSGVATETIAAVIDAFAVLAPDRALEAIWRLIRAANAELERCEPWKLPAGDALDAVLGDALETLRIVAVLVSPAMPETAQAIWSALGLAGRVDRPGSLEALSWGGYEGGLSVQKGAPLFPRREPAALQGRSRG